MFGLNCFCRSVWGACLGHFEVLSKSSFCSGYVASGGPLEEQNEQQCLHLDGYPGRCPIYIMKGACYSPFVKKS